MIRLFPEGKSRALSAVSLGVTAVAAVMAASALRDIFTMLEMFSTPAFFLALASSTVPAQMPPLAVLLTHHIRSAFVFALVFWFSVSVLALGVWLRREWARRGAVWMLYLLAGAGLLLVLYPWLVVPRPLFYEGVSIAPEFNAAVQTAAFMARVLSLLLGSLCLWWALALDRGRLRGEFVAVDSKPGI